MIDIVDRGRTYIRFEEPDNYEGHVVWLMADEIERLREALRNWDVLIKYQYTGSREAMSALQACAFETDEILNRSALEEKE